MYVESVWVVAVLCIWVGLMGGTSYVNILHCMLELKTLEKRERESAMSLSLFFNDFGITLAAATQIILANTLFSKANITK